MHLAQCRLVFFEHLLEGHRLALAARCIDLLRTLEAQVALFQERDIRGWTVPGDTEGGFDQAREVRDCPEATIRGCGVGAEDLARGVLLDGGADAVALGRSEFSTVAALAAIAKSREAVGAIASAPVHERGTGAAGNLVDLGKGIGRAIEVHCLQPGAGRTILALVIGETELAALSVGECELACCYAYIVRSLSELSISSKVEQMPIHLELIAHNNGIALC